MAGRVYDVIVVGAGVEGSATAYYLTSRYTKNVLLLEQFEANNLKGSSRGGSRCYHSDYGYALDIRLVKESLPLWNELEEKSGETLLWKSGALAFSKANDPKLSSHLNILSKNKVSFEVLSAEDVNDRYPQQLNIPGDRQCIFLPEGASIDAGLTLKTMQALFVRNGGEFKDSHTVRRLVSGSVVTMETDKGSFKAKKVVLATGAWTNQVLDSAGLGLELPMKIFQTEVFYFQVLNPKDFTARVFPAFFESILDYKNPISVYGIPILEMPNMIKVCEIFGDGDVEIGVEDIANLSPSQRSQSSVQSFMKSHFKGVDLQPALTETCSYANTPDFVPYIDTHPNAPNIIVAGGFSHGFKTSPVFGKIIAELAMGTPPSYDMSPFRIDRFN